MPTEAKEHEEHSYSARYLVVIFLVCVATCGVFFSLGFLVGYNERGSHSAVSTEVVTPPPAIPPTVNPPPDSGTGSMVEPASGQPAAGATPETEVIPPGETPATPAVAAKPTSAPAPAAPEEKPSPPPAPAAGGVQQGITLQVVASRSKQDADHVVNILKEKGYPVFLVTPEFAHSGDDYFRVQVGPFKSHDEAVKVRDRLKQDGFNPFIKH
jgi:cell division septation protein DedD